MANFAVVKGTRLRATRTDACGMPIAGPKSRVTTSGFVTVQVQPQNKDAEELEQLNAEGLVCVSDRTPPQLKWWNVTIEFCKVNTCLFSMLTGWDVLLDFAGKDIGYGDKKKIDSERGAALELWTGIGSDDTCDVPTTDDILNAGPGVSTIPRGYVLLPVVKEWQLSDGFEVGASIATFTLSGITAPGARWGRGPYNVIPNDVAGNAGRLEEGFINKERQLIHLRTTIAPPVAEDECCPLILPTPYYGPTAADTAPNQPACNAVGSNEVQTITLTGDSSLSFQNQPTSVVDVPAATALQVKALLEGLSTIGVGNVTVTGPAGGPYVVTFIGALAGVNLPLIVLGVPANGTVVQTTQGGVYA